MPSSIRTKRGCQRLYPSPKSLAKQLKIILKKFVNLYPVMKDVVGDKKVGSGFDGILRK